MIKVNNTNIQTVRVEHDGDNVPAIAVIARDTKNNRTRVVYQLEGVSFLNVTRVGDLNSEITILNNTPTKNTQFILVTLSRKFFY